MALELTNTLSGKKELFTPSTGKNVRMYSCGPTVYSATHIGHLRAYIFVDILKRTLRLHGYNVRHVINITDVGHLVGDGNEGEDKIELGAKREGVSARDITEKYTHDFMDSITGVGVDIRGVQFPRASEYIKEQIALIQTLEKDGHTYTISDGVYFDTSTFPHYGKLGNIPIESLEEGARIESTQGKRHASDFALWKFSGDIKRLQEWESPWGVGFPGWHIECSAMIEKLLGRTIDIHTGGIEHVGTHHNNEIAQSESAHHSPLARFWLHNGHLMVNGKKMAKSEGTLYTLKQLSSHKYDPLALRYLFLETHYRSPLSFSLPSLHASHTALMRLRSFATQLPSSLFATVHKESMEQFTKALSDDLNTAEALAVLWKLVKNTSIPPHTKRMTLKHMDKVIGLNIFLAPAPLPSAIRVSLKKIDSLRQEKKYEESDALRKEISLKGFTVQDTPEGSIAIPTPSTELYNDGSTKP